MRCNKQKKRIEFVTKMYNSLIGLGASVVGEDSTSHIFSMETPYGNLKIILNKEDNHLFTFSIFSRFDNPNLASKSVNCNKFSGKYNYISIEKDVDVVVCQMTDWFIFN